MLESDDPNPVVNTIHGYANGDGFTIVTRRYRKSKAVNNDTIKGEPTNNLRRNKADIAENYKPVKNKTAVNRQSVKISKGENRQNKRAKAHYI